MSIKFDNVEILDTTHIPRFMMHEDVADRTLMTVPMARDDGDVLIYERYAKKIIKLQGTLTAASQAALDAAIDIFKELFARPEKNLDIDWNGGTMRFVASCTKHSFTRDHYNTSAVPWTAEFTVSSGVGHDTTITTALNADAETTTLDSSGNYTVASSYSLIGSKAPRPLITITLAGTPNSNMRGIQYTDLDTGERMIVTRNVDMSGLAGKSIVIDCANKMVTDNLSTSGQVEGNFYGTFPNFSIGTNNVSIQTGGIINQASSDFAQTTPSAGLIFTLGVAGRFYAQSFQVPATDSTFSAVTLALTKSGTPVGNLNWRMVGDSGGLPNTGGTTIASAMITSYGSVPSYPNQAWVTIPTATFTLNANTPYWILVYFTGTYDPSNGIYIGGGTSITYPKGSTALSSDYGSTWTPDSNTLSFKLLFGGLPASTQITHTVNYTKTYL